MGNWNFRGKRECEAMTTTPQAAGTNSILNRVLLGMAMQFWNQLSGNESINFYAPVILDRIFSDNALLPSSLLLGFINLIAVIVALFTVGYIGRLPLFVWGVGVMIIAQVANSMLTGLKTLESQWFVSHFTRWKNELRPSCVRYHKKQENYGHASVTSRLSYTKRK